MTRVNQPLPMAVALPNAVDGPHAPSSTGDKARARATASAVALGSLGVAAGALTWLGVTNRFGDKVGLLAGGAVLGAALIGTGLYWLKHHDLGTARPGDVPITRQPRISDARLVPVADGLTMPISVTFAPGDDSTAYVGEKAGKLVAVDVTSGEQRPVLDLSSKVDTYGGERGLLSVAFHPDFQENGKLYVDYVDRQGATAVVEYTMDDGAIDESTARTVLSEPHPQFWHYSGQLQFGQDGLLYIGLGDGGGGGDPENRSQDMQQLHGKILRIDVDRREGGRQYAIPADNPYASGEDGRPEVFASGLRNPWRFSFDRGTGDMYIADVGQNIWEEVNILPAGSKPGANFGWDVLEGTHGFEDKQLGGGYQVDPFLEYRHDSEHVAVIGGYVYRGTANPALQGYYLYSDLMSKTVTGLRMENGRPTSRIEIPQGGQIVAYGQNNAGEIFTTSLDGSLQMLDAAGATSPSSTARSAAVRPATSRIEPASAASVRNELPVDVRNGHVDE